MQRNNNDNEASHKVFALMEEVGSLTKCPDTKIARPVIITATWRSCFLGDTDCVADGFSFGSGVDAFRFPCSPQGTGQRAPNILVVLIDDMGWSDLSCCRRHGGQTRISIGWPAKACVFRNFYVNSPICSPSRTALTTGTTQRGMASPPFWRIVKRIRARPAQLAGSQGNDASPLAEGSRLRHWSLWQVAHGGQRDVWRSSADQ